MVNTQRPGVFSSYEITSAVSGSGRGGTVGVVARSAMSAGEGIVSIASWAAAVSSFGRDCAMSELVRTLFLNGAAAVAAYPIDSGETQEYAKGFAALQAHENVRLLVCDSREAAVHTAMKESILSAPESGKYRVGVVEAAPGTAASLTSAAAALGCERIVLVPGEVGAGREGMAAAALAGVIAGSSDPAVPLNGAQLLGLAGIDASYSDAEITWLIEGGVTPLENSQGSVFVVRGVTTRAKTDGVADATWREITTTLIVDDVITSIRGGLRSRFARAKNTAQTRGAIRTQVVIGLEEKKAREIIESYENVRAEASAEDPTVCEVSFGFTVAHGLNQIHLVAHITV